jgi:hypothetical protein
VLETTKRKQLKRSNETTQEVSRGRHTPVSLSFLSSGEKDADHK